ncbi:MAG TPA: MFS transporter [Propionibacteriaceae bacterium]|nr:MFS transporter [Propionibacteriaceae bacterium]
MKHERHDATAELLDSLSKVIRTSRALSQRRPSRYGFGGTPLGILKILGTGDARAGDLAGALQIAPSVVSPALVPLEQSQLIEGPTDPADARVAPLGLTETGRQRLAQVRHQTIGRFAPMLDSWDSADIDSLAQLLGRLEKTIWPRAQQESAPVPSSGLRPFEQLTDQPQIPPERRYRMTITAVAAPPVAPAGELTHRQILEVMTGLLAALFTAMISTTIVSTALPTIMSDLNGTQRQYTWVITSSLLAMTITTPVWGKLSDLFSKKILIQLSIVLFVVGSIGAGLSQTVPPMMAFRAVQGVAMGGLIAVAQSIMGSIIPPRQRGRYSGYMGAVMAVSTVSGPLLGGVLTDSVNWRWCFYVCVPLAVISLILLQITLHLPTKRRHVKIDYVGAGLIAVVAALPMLWVTFAGNDFDFISWPSGLYLGGFAVAVALTIVTELKVSEPMVPIRVLHNRTPLLMILASVGVGVAMFASSTFLTQYFQLAGGHTPTRAGLMTIPLIVAQMLSSTIGGQLVTRTGRWKPLMVFGSIMLLVGLALMGTLDHTTPFWQVAIFMSIMGVGIGALIQNIVLAVQNTVDVSQVGATSATVSFFRSLGGAVGVAVLGAVLANHVTAKVVEGLQAAGVPSGGGAGATLDLKDLPAPIQLIVRSAYGDSFGVLFLIAAAVSVLTLISVLLVREVPLRNTIELRLEAAEVPAEATDPSTAEVSQSWDDPDERLSVAALDVLTAAQDQARQHLTTSAGTQQEALDLLNSLGRQVDSAVVEFHHRLDAVKHTMEATDGGASLNRDGVGADRLRLYEYGLLLNSQRTADRVTQIARSEAERILTDADRQVAELEERIGTLRAVEAELGARVADRVKQS